MFDKGVCSRSDIPGLNFIYLLNPFSDNRTACFLSSVSIQLIPPIIFMYTPGEPHFEVHSEGFFLKGLWATICKPHRISAIFRRVGKKVTLHSFLNLNCLFFLYGKICKIVQILPGYEVWHRFQAQTIVHCTVLGRLTKLTRRQRSHPIWPYSFQLDQRQLQCYIIPCSKFQPRWWMECSGRVNTWECLQALLAQPWLYSKSWSIQLDYWHLTMYMYL